MILVDNSCVPSNMISENQCHLDIAICQANRHGFTLALAHNNSCGSLDKLVFHCDALCDEEGQKSYCASNGNTYGWCKFKISLYI